MHDYHIHTARCGHAREDVEQYVISARNKGIMEIGFADHFPMYWVEKSERDPGLAMEFEKLPYYIEDIRNLQQKFRDMTIWLGVEVDYIPGWEEILREHLEFYPFDYVIGSIHFIDGWGFDNPDERDKYYNLDIYKLYNRYFQLLQQAARSSLFDIMAHPDLVKKFGFRPEEDVHSLYRQTARVFKENNVWVEINAAGLRAPVNEIYPNKYFLEECKKVGLKFTFGSDAHSPEQVGMGLEQVLKLINIDNFVSLWDKSPHS